MSIDLDTEIALQKGNYIEDDKLMGLKPRMKMPSAGGANSL